MSDRMQWWPYDIWYPKGRRLNAPWHHHILLRDWNLTGVSHPDVTTGGWTEKDSWDLLPQNVKTSWVWRQPDRRRRSDDLLTGSSLLCSYVRRNTESWLTWSKISQLNGFLFIIWSWRRLIVGAVLKSTCTHVLNVTFGLYWRTITDKGHTAPTDHTVRHLVIIIIIITPTTKQQIHDIVT